MSSKISEAIELKMEAWLGRPKTFNQKLSEICARKVGCFDTLLGLMAHRPSPPPSMCPFAAHGYHHHRHDNHRVDRFNQL